MSGAAVKKSKAEWFSTEDIPEGDRKGTYKDLPNDYWDYSGPATYVTHYRATPEEQEIIEANVRARKDRADKAYKNVPEEVKPAIEGVLYGALDKIKYGRDPFAKHDFSEVKFKAPSGFLGFGDPVEVPVEKPDGPGRVMFVNSRTIIGGATRPNNVEAIKRAAIVEGMDMVFPAAALKDYMKHFLSMPFMDRDSQYMKAHDLDMGLPAAKMKSFIHRIVPHGGDRALNIPVRKDFDDARNMLDRSNSKTQDNLHDRNVAAISEFIKKKPEYVVALFMWTQALTDYCRDLKSYVRTEMGSNLQEIMKEAPFWDTVALFEGGNNEMKHFSERYDRNAPNIDQGNDKLVNTVGPNSFLYLAPVVSAVVGALLEQSGITHKDAAKRDVNPETYKEAFAKLSESGMFQKGHKGEDGQLVLIRCPMTKKMGEWLTLDMGEDGRPEDQVLARLVEKVRDELAAPGWNVTKKMEDIAVYEIKKLWDTQEVKNIQQALDTRDKGKCPYHYGLK